MAKQKSGQLPGHPRYKGISARAFEHPADRAATSALGRIPLFDTLVKTLLSLQFERGLFQVLLGNGVRLGPTQLPRLWDMHGACYATLDVAAVPPLYLVNTPFTNAMAIGAKRPTVLLWSGISGLLDENELRAVLAHEAGHVLAEHQRYRTTLELLLRFSLPRLPVLGQAPLRALRVALLAWYRATELTCDRAAAIVLRDPLVPCSALMKMAGGNVEGLNLDAFIQQSDDYIEWDDLFDRRLRMSRELSVTHPFPVRRVHELTRWVRGGDYDRIVSGHYVRRGEEPPPSAEFAKAVEHYSERFGELVERTGVGINQLSKRIASWIESLRGEDAEDEEDLDDD